MCPKFTEKVPFCVSGALDHCKNFIRQPYFLYPIPKLPSTPPNPTTPDHSCNIRVRLRAAEAKSLANISLAANPKQARVLIDLATAEWLLGEYDNSEKHAREATSLRPDLPGPHGTLALVAVVRNDLVTAAKEAEAGVKLSERHLYYLAIQAIVFEASGNKKGADSNIKEAWNGEYPSEDQLRKWFLKDKPLEILLTVIKRQKPSASK